MPLLAKMSTSDALAKLREIKARQSFMPGYKSIKPGHQAAAFIRMSRDRSLKQSPKAAGNHNGSAEKLQTDNSRGSLANVKSKVPGQDKSLLHHDSQITLSDLDSESDNEEEKSYLPPFSRTNFQGPGGTSPENGLFKAVKSIDNLK